ncbi:MAG TPA: TlpA disulfide reductase family protein [Candidatus Limnocylindria bacterium]|nr:TlpA disulfide reductase family protein [Candidatus Limnocylindria bacterium]
MTAAVDGGRPRMPRAIAAIVIGAIALASLAALLWPSLPVANFFSGPTEVGVVRRLIADPNAAPRIGGIAPDFEWNAPTGKTEKLSDLRGKPVVLTFWATWCEPCRREFPAMQRVAASSAAAFLAVDLLEDGSKVRSFMDSLALDRIDPLLDTDGALTRAYAVIELPQTFFIDPRGVIGHIERGELDEAGIRHGIEKAR